MLNPFRYRGYYYDTETGLYYLQSRYYDPQIGRFINADNYVSTGQGLLGYNMFAYCRNNPVSRKDMFGFMDADIFDDTPSNFFDNYTPTGGGGYGGVKTGGYSGGAKTGNAVNDFLITKTLSELLKALLLLLGTQILVQSTTKTDTKTEDTAYIMVRFIEVKMEGRSIGIK